MKILVAEDNRLFANTVEMIVEELGYELIAIVDNATELLRLNAATEPDLILLDIQLVGEKDGIDIATQIADSERFVPVIFMTAFKDSETFQRAKKLNPFAYLIKPFDAMQLQRTIELAFYKQEQEILGNSQLITWEKDILIKDSIFVKVEQRLEKIAIQSISHIDVLVKHTCIYTQKGNFTVRMSLKELYAKLPPNTFIQINRHTLINVEYIEHIDLQESQIMVGDKYINISRKYKDYVLEKLNII